MGLVNSSVKRASSRGWLLEVPVSVESSLQKKGRVSYTGCSNYSVLLMLSEGLYTHSLLTLSSAALSKLLSASQESCAHALLWCVIMICNFRWEPAWSSE